MSRWLMLWLECLENAEQLVFFKNLKLIFFYVLDCFDILILKIIFKKIKKYIILMDQK